MTKKTWALALALCVSGALAPNAVASDHDDMSAKAKTDLATTYGPRDIANLYTWVDSDSLITNSPKRAFMILTVYPNAPKATAAFDTNTLYTFHTIAKDKFADSSDTPTLEITCAFGAGSSVSAQKFECWGGADEYVAGTGSATPSAGTSQSDSGKLRVWAGIANDPTYHNRAALNQTLTTIKGSLAGWGRDAGGCVTSGLSAATATAIRTGLAGATDTYLGQNVLVIAVSADIDYLTIKRDPVTKADKKLPLLGVWASTKKRIPQ